MTGFMLDTNIASHVIKGDRLEISQRLAKLPMEEITISAITEGELLYGLAKRGNPKALSERIHQFLIRVDVLPWDHEVTRVYGELRAACEAKGISLSAHDMLIAGHAAATNCVLITRDKVFARIPAPFAMEKWL